MKIEIITQDASANETPKTITAKWLKSVLPLSKIVRHADGGYYLSVNGEERFLFGYWNDFNYDVSFHDLEDHLTDWLPRTNAAETILHDLADLCEDFEIDTYDREKEIHIELKLSSQPYCM